MKVGFFHRGMGRLDEARQHLWEAYTGRRETLGVAAAPTLKSLRELVVLARVLRSAGRAADATRLLEELTRVSAQDLLSEEENVNLLGSLHELYLEAGDSSTARRLATQHLDLRRAEASREGATAAQKNDYASSLLTIEPMDLRDPSTALLFARQASEQASHLSPDFLGTLALALFETGDTSGALETQARAMTRLPPIPPEGRDGRPTRAVQGSGRGFVRLGFQLLRGG